MKNKTPGTKQMEILRLLTMQWCFDISFYFCRQIINTMKKSGLFVAVLALFFASCSPKRLLYLQESFESTDSSMYYLRNETNYLINPNDILWVKVNSVNQEVQALFNGGEQNSNLSSTSGTQQGAQSGRFFFSGYLVNDTGYINLPLMGMLKVSGLTFAEATRVIEDRAAEFLEEAYIQVRFVNFKVSFLGEVNSPGTYIFLQHKLDIFEGLLKAGDITDYGDRRRVLIVRETPQGKQTYRVNLRERNVLESEKFYLMPNDIVYVEPLTARMFRTGSADFLYVLTTLTSLITTTLLVVNLSNNTKQP